jgi:hypothetical protein
LNLKYSPDFFGKLPKGIQYFSGAPLCGLSHKTLY